ncbi:MAG: DUF3098 domain-containing protein [Bacteroidetes bacterium]|nr:DUF3098 domain-containing protein [Bacteroidota bacterium]MBS1930970.1 DUF3098 domain-containing protein [Bacteroidota bacterium]
MPEKKTSVSPSLFGKQNYTWMIAGVVVIAIGMFLMSGGQSNLNPAVFDAKAVYSPVRITVAPIVIIIGWVIEIFAIFKSPRQAE